MSFNHICLWNGCRDYPLKLLMLTSYLKRYSIKENGQEPVESDRGDFNVDGLQVAAEGGEFLCQEIFEHLLVRLSPDQVLIKVVARKVLLCHSNQCPVGMKDIVKNCSKKGGNSTLSWFLLHSSVSKRGLIFYLLS